MKDISNAITGEAGGGGLTVRVAREGEIAAFDAQLGERHYLGAGQAVGDYPRQIAERAGQPVALLVWGPACYALKDRDRWIGWSVPQRVPRLKLIAQNRRFLLLTAKGQAPNLGSPVLGAALRALPEQWQAGFGYAPLLAESFTAPEAHAGTCYKASNWEAAGWSAGYRRHRAGFYVPNARPKRLWLRELRPGARRQLRAVAVPEDCRGGLVAPPTGLLPLKLADMDSLAQTLRHAPDPRATNTQYRLGPVLTLVALALLAGRREIAEIARFATTLTQTQRRRLRPPRKRGTRAFCKAPGYDVFYQVLTRLDPEAFATLFNDWLQARAGTLPQALDGKMIRDHIGRLSLAQHEDGVPHAVAVYDQKAGAERCELTAATALLEKLPALDGKLITADPLHNQRKHARTIVGKGGDYRFQVKDNQPRLFKHAQSLDALHDTPFLPTPRPPTDGWKSAGFIPAPSNP